MGWWKFGRRKSAWPGSKPVVRQERASGGILGFHAVRQLIHEALASYDPPEFYELELAEVMEVILTEDQLPELEDGSGKDWNAMGGVRARGIESQRDQLPVDTLIPIFPLHPNNSTVPIRGEMVILINFKEKGFYISLLNFFNSPNTNLLPGLSGARDEEMREEDFKYEHFDLEDYENIRRIWPYQGDNIYQGRWGQSIRFGSNIIPDSHEDGDSTQHSPNIIIRAGQLLDADAFGKGRIVEDLKNDVTLKKTVKEDINADGSSVWMTTDQSVKLNRTKSNSQKHRLMSKVHNDKNPIDGGKQIVINSDRITFNTKRNEIMGYSANGIGWGTPWSFTIDADRQFCVSTPRTRFYTGEYSVLVGPDAMNSVVGGGHPESGEPEPFPLVGPDAVDSNLASACGISIGEKVLISSACPSFLTLDDKAHLQSCKGAILHLDDCAGLKDNQGSFLRIGGEALGITGYVKGRDDMGQQHLVYGEELTNLMDSICNSFVELGGAILDLTAIPTGAGPSGPISGGPPNVLAIEAWIAGVETIRARLCDLLMKPE
jgi:hypothetical protein